MYDDDLWISIIYMYINFLFTNKTGSTQKTHKKTNLNKLNQRATCSQISRHGGQAEHWVGQN